MLKVNFYDKDIVDKALEFAVIAAKYNRQWVLCKHRERDTYEVPGGHWENGETIEETAKRELFEETGAVDFTLKPIAVYGVERDGSEICGKLFFANVTKFSELPKSEIEKIEFFDSPPDNWTYPLIQPLLLKKLESEFEINGELKEYVEKNIIPRYKSFDKAHNISHVNTVIKNSMEYAEQYHVDFDMAYTVAAYHDAAMNEGRKEHHINSARFLREDESLKKWFTSEQILKMSEAIEDHRASSANPPRGIYGAIVSEADRDVDAETIVYRVMEYSKVCFSEIPDFEGHYKRTKEHIEEKYGENGYIKLWLNSERNTNGLKKLREWLKDDKALREECKKYW